MFFSSQTSKGVRTRSSPAQEMLRALLLLCNLADFICFHKMFWFAIPRPSLHVRLWEALSGADYDSKGSGGWLFRGNTDHASLFPSHRDRWEKKDLCLISWHVVDLIVYLIIFLWFVNFGIWCLQESVKALIITKRIKGTVSACSRSIHTVIRWRLHDRENGGCGGEVGIGWSKSDAIICVVTCCKVCNHEHLLWEGLWTECLE